jgi:hypothetical protein
MAGEKRLPDVSVQILKEANAHAKKINIVEYGEIGFVVQSGKVQRVRIEENIATKSPRGGE